MILSNQIECKYCGDKPFSANVHDYKTCKCGSIAVDGGSSYLKRTGDPENMVEMSISMDDELVKCCTQNIEDMLQSKRNPLGVLCGIARTLRDNGYEITKKELK